MVDYWLEKYYNPMHVVVNQYPEHADDPMLRCFYEQYMAMHAAMVRRIKELVGDDED